MTLQWVRVATVICSIAGLGACGSDKSPTPVQPPALPTVVHLSVDPGRTNASLVARVDPRGSDAVAFVEYGVDPALDHRCGIVSIDAATGVTDVTVELDGLEPEAVFAFRWVAANDGGDTTSQTETFATLSSNRFPETQIGSAVVDTVLGEIRAHVFWRGADADGIINHFELWHAGRGQTSVEWIATSASDSMFVNISSPWVLLVRAVDNEGGIDATPDAFVFGNSALHNWPLHPPSAEWGLR